MLLVIGRWRERENEIGDRGIEPGDVMMWKGTPSKSDWAKN